MYLCLCKCFYSGVRLYDLGFLDLQAVVHNSDKDIISVKMVTNNLLLHLEEEVVV